VRRLPILIAVVAALVVAGLVDVTVSSTPAVPAAAPAASGAPVGAESSSWYCAGGSGTTGGPAAATLFLVNAGARAAGVTLTVSASSGATAAETLTVPAFGQTTAVPSALVQGPWLATRVDVGGGGVTVSQAVHGAQGWSEAPCASSTAPAWYFASGATASGNLLDVSVYNPGATMAVVDLTFDTPGGVVAPQQFQGLVLGSGAVATAEVGSFVQNQPWVAAVVRARAGQVVADELSVREGAVSGLSLRLGSPSPAPVWYLPRTVDVTGGATVLAIFNPTSTPEQVRVDIRLPSGPVAPVEHVVPAASTWNLETSALIRVPSNVDYATTVTADGAGVVVDRMVAAASIATPPQFGAVTAAPSGWTTGASGRWALANPAVTTPPVAGAKPFALDLFNPTDHAETVTVSVLEDGGERRLAGVPTLRIPPGLFTVVESPALAGADGNPLVASSTGPLAASLDATPAGMPGVVTLAAIPLGG
jgi:hypothetical protein